ncbi:MAG: hypothetical protein GX823_04480 [Clostridiales bacterium]|nr:hypothetical protein [Clostridiales bacterium]
MQKKLISLLLALMLCVGFAVPALAASEEAVAAADALFELGLFRGRDANEDGTPNYALDDGLTRHEAVTMLVRLLGKENDALVGEWETPFADVADWAKPYVGYAYENGITNGISETEFGGDSAASASMYLTYVLRALGYDSNSDFAWDAAWELTDELEITAGQYGADSQFLRGDAVVVSSNALEVTVKDGELTLLEVIRENLANAPEVLEPSVEPEPADSKFELSVELPEGWETLTGEFIEAFADELGPILDNFSVDLAVFDGVTTSLDMLYINTATGSSIAVASIAIPEDKVDVLTFDVLIEAIAEMEEEGFVALDNVTFSGETFAAFSASIEGFEDFDQNLYLSVVGDRVVIVAITCAEGDSIDTILGYIA